MNITNIQSAIAPVLAPIAPAILFGNNLHAGMIADGVNANLALVGSILGTGGVELSGALACSMAVMAYHRKDTKIMYISIAAAVVYAVFVMIGISQARNTATFAGAVIISLVAYLMQGIWQSYTNKLRVEQAVTDMQVKALDAQRKLTNAETRKAKAGGVQAQFRPFLSTGQTGHISAPLDPKVLELAGIFFSAHPGASARDWLRDPACPVKSPTTASKYKDAL